MVIEYNSPKPKPRNLSLNLRIPNEEIPTLIPMAPSVSPKPHIPHPKPKDSQRIPPPKALPADALVSDLVKAGAVNWAFLHRAYEP